MQKGPDVAVRALFFFSRGNRRQFRVMDPVTVGAATAGVIDMGAPGAEAWIGLGAAAGAAGEWAGFGFFFTCGSAWATTLGAGGRPWAMSSETVTIL